MTMPRTTMKPSRPILRWHGGKWILAPWIIEHMPEHRVYVEPFGGAGSVLMRKPRSYAEIWNDLDDQVVNLFQVLRDRGDELRNALYLTPFSRVEFMQAYGQSADPLEKARRTVVLSFMGFGSNGVHQKTGFRANSNRPGTTPARDWRNYPSQLDEIIERLRGVTIENRDAIEVMTAHDGPNTLHYVDPPYVKSTRTDEGDDYAHEMNDDQHSKLLQYLRGVQGKVILSGYPNPIYDDALSDWRRVTRTALADGAAKRVEVLWMNFECIGDLFQARSA